MPFVHIHYLPVGWPLFALLALVIVVLAVLVQLEVLRSVYMSLGVSSGVALLLLIGTLVGSTINVPLARLHQPHTIHAAAIDAFGEIYETPAVVDWPGTIIAANVGGALPALVPGVAAGAAGLVLSRRLAAPIAYVSGSLGVLIGADLMNLGKLQTMGASVASIGGAGTFDGVFLAGVIAVIIASLFPLHRSDRAPKQRG